MISLLVLGCTTQVVVQSGGEDTEDTSDVADRRTTKEETEGASAIGDVSPGTILHLGIHTDQKRGLWQIDTDGTGLKKVLPDYVDAKWSPDNKQIAYVSTDLWVMNADSSTKVKVADAGVTEIDSFEWRKDGKYIVYENNGIGYVDMAIKDELQIVPVIGTKISSPTWAGNRIAYIDDKYIKKVDAAKGSEPEIWLTLKDPTHLKASPNDDWLAFNNNGAFWIAPDEKGTSDFTQVADTTVSELEWSPDSKKIVFAAGSSVYIYDVATAKKVTVNAKNEDRFTWSRDSLWIAFTQKSSDAAEDIWFVKADGKGLKKFTNCPTACEMPDWSN
ncbi:hypothetical protein KY316_02985 [Candidatus Woesearchaeota archaeon]|nr:hypothetical protein [Candidatus Woesearchaeota archaeon]